MICENLSFVQSFGTMVDQLMADVLAEHEPNGDTVVCSIPFSIKVRGNLFFICMKWRIQTFHQRWIQFNAIQMMDNYEQEGMNHSESCSSLDSLDSNASNASRNSGQSWWIDRIEVINILQVAPPVAVVQCSFFPPMEAPPHHLPWPTSEGAFWD